LHTNYIYNNIFSICEHRSLADKMNVKSMDFLLLYFVGGEDRDCLIFLITYLWIEYFLFFMNIAYIIPSLKPAGPINVVYDLVRLMQEHSHHCDVYYFDDLNVDNYFPCDVYKIGMGDKIDFQKYNVIHSHGLRPNIYIFRHKPIKYRNTQFISTFHNYVFDDFVMKYGKMKGYVGGMVFILTALRHDKIVALSKDAQKYYSKWFGKKKVSYIYNTRIVDTESQLTDDEKQELLNFKGNGKLIGMNGSILYRKGIDIALKALPHLPERFKLFFVGEGGDLETMKAVVHDLNIQDRVCFAGRRPDAFRYLPYYDIFAIPSRSEGFPLALLEAAFVGKKVVSSDLPIIKETFTQDELVMFKNLDEKEFAKAILKAEQNEVIANNIRNKFANSYSPEHFYNNHIDLYTETK